VGTLVQVGRRQIHASQVKSILDSKDRRKAGPTAEPQGLCLVSVEYPKSFAFKKENEVGPMLEL